MRRACVITAGLALAVPASMLTLIGTLLLADAGQGSGPILFRLLELLSGLAWSEDPERLLRALCRIAALTCCMPVVLSALIGEAAGLTTRFWYIGATSALAAALPLVANRDAGTTVDSQVLLCLALAGTVAGSVYAAAAAPSSQISSSAASSLPSGPP